jgi:hypothetical protein
MFLPALMLAVNFTVSQVSAKSSDGPAIILVSNLSQGQYDKVENSFDSKMRSAVPLPKLKEVWSDVITDAGDYKSIISSNTIQHGQYKVIRSLWQFQKEKVQSTVALDTNGKVAGLYFKPANADSQQFSNQAKALITDLSNNDFDAVEATFDSVMTQSFPKSSLQSFWSGMISQNGKFDKIVSVTETWSGPYTVDIVVCQFEKAKVDATVSYDSTGKVAGLYFKPHKG